MRMMLVVSFFLIYGCSVGQDSSFNEKKWKENVSEGTCSSYRGCVDLKLVFAEVNGNSEEEVKKILGEPDFSRLDENGILYYTYLIDNAEEEKNGHRKMQSSISFLLEDSIVFDVVRANVGG